MALANLVWTVSFRLPNQSAQAEITKYTEQAADKVAAELEMLGAVVVVMEHSVEETVQDENELRQSGQRNSKLDWTEADGNRKE